MKRGAVLFFLVWLSLSGSAQWLETGGPLFAGLAHSGSAWTAQLWQAHGNPAALASLARPEVGVSMASHFLVQELSPAYLAAALPFQDRHTLGLGIRSVGFGGFRETLVGLAYAYELEWVALGARLNAQVADFAQYGTQTAWLVDAGAVVNPLKPLWISAWVANATQAAYPTAESAQLPRMVVFGGRYQVRKGLALLLDAALQDNQPTDCRLGAVIEATPTLNLQLGVRTNPIAASFGITFQTGGLRIAIASGYQTQLGTTPVVGVSHAFGGEEGGAK